MARTVFITGGARSGKSRLAEEWALRPCGRAVYIATAQLVADDAEMADRIARHRARRGPAWDDLHAPTDLCAALRASDGGAPRLVDCLTLWLTNLMLSDMDWRAETEALTAEIARQKSPVILVGNEVGLGIVPETALGRSFRDAAGWVNQAVAQACEEVWLAVAGQPIRIKPHDHPF